MRQSGTLTTSKPTMRSIISYFVTYIFTLIQRNECLDNCPGGSHCEWGFCECNQDFTKAWGQCHQQRVQPGSPVEDRNVSSLTKSCTQSKECQKFDINSICTDGACACRKDMKWNPKAQECQVSQSYM